MENIDYDGAWKEALEYYLRPFLELCFPVVAAGINWQAGLEFLDKELQEVVRDANLGKQRADKLVKVQRLDGTEEWLLIHVEVQAQQDAELPRRMFQYHHRIADRYGRPVVSLAVLADSQAEWRPGTFQEELWGCRLQFDYPVCKLLDWARQPRQLEANANPAAMVIAAHLAAQSTGGDMPKRHRDKWELTRRLYERGYAKQDILELYRLLDWLLVLPDDLAVVFRRELMEYEEEKAMPYVTSIEKIGRQEGRLQALREALLDLVEARFGAVPYGIRELILALKDEVEVKRLLRQAGLAQTLQEFSGALTPDS